MSFEHVSLPKWPQMIVTGKNVTIDQAKDIIFRTDRFLTEFSEYSGGNNYTFNQQYRDKAGITNFLEKKFYQNFDRYIFEDKIKEELQIIDTEYVNNNWASSCYIYGPHGWCSPEGKIYYRDNVGKWPSVYEIEHDWQNIATAFPYLDLHVTFMNGEHCEDHIKPLINIRVINGTAFIEEPNLSVHNLNDFVERNFGVSEIGLPKDWYDEFANKVNNAINKVLP